MIGAIAIIIGGTVVFGSNTSTAKQTAAAAEAARRRFSNAPSYRPRLRAAQRSPPPASIICIDTSSFCLNPQNVEEKKSHERKQHISRGVSRQQDELANERMEYPARSGATREAKRGDIRLEGVGRKTSIRNRRHGVDRSARPKSLATRHRRYKQ